MGRVVAVYLAVPGCAGGGEGVEKRVRGVSFRWGGGVAVDVSRYTGGGKCIGQPVGKLLLRCGVM